MLDPATARLCVWRLPLEAAFRLFSKLGSLGGSIRERFSRTGRTRPALARPAFSRWLLENDRLRERWPCQWLNVLYFPFSETSPTSPPGSLGCLSSSSSASFADRFRSYWPRPASTGDFFNGLLELVSAGQFDGQGDHHTPKPFVRKAFAKYLECGIFAHGFARARCGDCGHD